MPKKLYIKQSIKGEEKNIIDIPTIRSPSCCPESEVLSVEVIPLLHVGEFSNSI